MYVRRSITAGELIEKLQESIGELSLLDDDTPVVADIWVGKHENLINEIAENHEVLQDLDKEQLEEVFSYIQPKSIHQYFLDAEDNARDYETFYDMLRGSHHRSWHNDLKMQVPEQMRKKYGL